MKGVGDYMDIAYRRAYTNVLYLIKTIDKRLQSKISTNFIEFMKEKQDKTYTPQNISLSNPDSLSQETKNIISLIYRNYLNESNKQYQHDKTKMVEKVDEVELKTISDDKSIAIQTKSNNIFRKIHNFIKRIFKHGGKA